MRTPKKSSSLGFLLILAALMISSCNVFSPSDKPTADQDLYLDAVAKANAGDCDSAQKILINIPNPTDNMLIALGWAQLCIAGVKAGDIAKSLYSYSSSSNNLTVVGTLAKVMLPYDSSKASNISAAITSFTGISNSSKQNIELGIAHFVKAASVLAAQAVNSGSSDLEKIDTGPIGGCDGVDCSTGSAGCVAGMSNTDVNSFISEISSASTALGNAGATDLKNLANVINAGFGAGGTQARCFIYQNTIP